MMIGQPNVDEQKSTIRFIIPKMLSFLTYRAWEAEVKGLNAFPQDHWPDNILLLYFSYHIMVGLGTIFIAIMVIAGFCYGEARFLRHVDALDSSASSAVSLHREHRGLDDRRTRSPAVAGLRVDAHRDGYSKTVSAGNGLFTLLGFLGMYTVLGILFLFLVAGKSTTGPRSAAQPVRASLTRGRYHGNSLVMIVAVMIAAYVVLDGFDLGAGIIYLFVAKDRDGVDVCVPSGRCGTETKFGCWLPAARFTSPIPQLYASAFSGFYLPLMMVCGC